MSAGWEEDATKLRSICSFSFWRGILGLKNISLTTTKSTRQSTRCQVPARVRVKKRHEPLGDLVPFIFRIRFASLGGGGGGPCSLLCGFGFLPRYLRQQRRIRGYRRRMQRNELFLFLFHSFGTSGSRNLARSIVAFAGAFALGPTFALVICVPVPTGVALPFPPSSNRFTVPPSLTPCAWTWNRLSRVGPSFRSSRVSSSGPSLQIPLGAGGRRGRLAPTAPAGAGR